jgi:hypothetical protein
MFEGRAMYIIVEYAICTTTIRRTITVAILSGQRAKCPGSDRVIALWYRFETMKVLIIENTSINPRTRKSDQPNEVMKSEPLKACETEEAIRKLQKQSELTAYQRENSRHKTCTDCLRDSVRSS